MPFAKVNKKHMSDFSRPFFVEIRQPLGKVVMHGGLAYSELLCRLSHRSVVFYKIICFVQYSCVYFVIHGNVIPPSVYLMAIFRVLCKIRSAYHSRSALKAQKTRAAKNFAARVSSTGNQPIYFIKISESSPEDVKPTVFSLSSPFTNTISVGMLVMP